ncbi:MAG: sigma-54-dependent Fis family transcriptional regulator [Thermicanus sp.]|nr:sigma-54-dependent Fis family transcriptional regulator [Thermicanus sp.]
MQHLTSQIKGTGHMVALTDHHGRIVYLEGDQPILKKGEEIHFLRGADWSEKTAGTNAIGTSLALAHPIQIFAYEHFSEGFHPWTCASAPIHDPFTGELLGAIDLTGPTEFGQPHTLGIATMTASIIQQEYKEISHKNYHILHQYFLNALQKYKHDPLMVLSSTLQVIDASEKTFALFQMQDLHTFWSLPGMDGLREALLHQRESKTEIELTSRSLKIISQLLMKDGENIGYLLHIKRSERKPIPRLVPEDPWEELIGQSQVMKELIQKGRRVSPTNVPVLLTGESGTGKEKFAQAIHRSSLRHKGPFVAINCGAIPKELMASELFGYEPGTFTGGNPKGKAGKFEEANGGTLFLDEIGEMPLDLQIYLLRVLQEKEVMRLGSSKPIQVDVRILAATNRNLEEMVAKGLFRADLYFRLNVVELKLPPLRERREDIPLLCRYFLRKSAMKHQKQVLQLDEEVMNLCMHHAWPGNLRQLENVIEHALIFAHGDMIQRTDLPASLFFQPEMISEEEMEGEEDNPLAAEEKRLLLKLILETDGNLSEVARRCNIARSTLYRKLRKYKIKMK